jgi:conjugal transfer mating pair stabilization protein TraN
MKPSRIPSRVLGVAISAIAATVMFAAMSSAHAADCVKNTEVCVEGPATRDIGGFPVYRDCWRTTSEYSCLSQNSTDDCQPLRDRGCSQVGSSCVETNPQGACMVFEQTWQCRVASGTTSTVTNCGSQQFCIDGQCFDTSHAPDPTSPAPSPGWRCSAKPVATSTPTRWWFSRATTTAAARSSSAWSTVARVVAPAARCSATMSLISGAGGQAIGAIGSSYTYDALFASDAPDLVIAGFEGLFGAGGGSSALAGLIAGDLSVSSFITSLVPGPWTIAMSGHPALRPAVVRAGRADPGHEERQPPVPQRGQLLLDQDPDHRHLRRDHADLLLLQLQARPHPERTGARPARPQLGRRESPDCSGFTVAQLQSLDFSRMDLTEFYAEIAPKMPDVGALQQQAQQRVNSYFGP